MSLEVNILYCHHRLKHRLAIRGEYRRDSRKESTQTRLRQSMPGCAVFQRNRPDTPLLHRSAERSCGVQILKVR